MKARRVVGAAASAAVAGYVLAGRSRLLRWGATDDEVASRLPGDDLIDVPHLVATRAITIGAPAADAWPWIVQLGQNRGGFYSYDTLENLFGCDIHSADRVVPEWQDVQVGDDVNLAPEVALTVAVVEPEHAFVLRGGVPLGEASPPYDFTWSFVLREDPPITRFVVRERYRYASWWSPLLVEPVEIVSFVMHQKMLRGIRDRAERPGRSRRRPDAR